MSGDQLITLASGIKISPVVRKEQIRSKATVALLPKSIDLRMYHVWCADSSETGIIDERDHFLHVIAGNCHLREGSNGLKIVKPLFYTVLDVAVSLVHGFCAVNKANQSPLAPINAGFVMCCLLFHHVPVKCQGIETRCSCSANG